MIHSHFVSWGPENVYWNRRPMIPVISVLKIPFQPPICRLVLWGGCATMCYLPRLILNSPNWDSVKSPRFFPCILGYLGYLYFWDTPIFRGSMPCQEVCQETDSSHVVSEIFSLMNDALVAKWICGGLTAVDYMSANELEQCPAACEKGARGPPNHPNCVIR